MICLHCGGEMNNYVDYRKYESHASFGVHTIFVEPNGRRRPQWSVRFMGAPVWTTGFKNKFDAMIYASHALGYSMKRCNWTPI